MRQTRDLARVGWRGLAPFLPIGPHKSRYKRPRLADSFLAPGSGARGIPRVARPWGATRCCKSLFHYRCLHTWLNDDSEVETSMEPINTACPGCRRFVSKSASRMLA